MGATAEEIVGVIFQGKDEVSEIQKRIEKRLGDIDKTAQRASGSLRKSFQNAASSIAVLEGPLGGVAGRVNAIGAALARVGPGFILFGTAVSATLFSMGKGIALFTEYEHQMSRLEGTLRATGNQSGVTARQIDAIAISLGKATLTSRSEVLNAAAVLTTFGNIGSQNFERVLKVAQDMAEVFQTDLVSSVRLLGRAIEDPANNLEVLRRRIPAFTKDVVDGIKDLADAGKELEAQDSILKIIEQKVGGAGEVTGLAAALDTLGEEVRQLDNYLGQQLSPAAEAGIKLLTKLFESINNYIGTGEDIGAMTDERLKNYRNELAADTTAIEQKAQELRNKLNQMYEAQSPVKSPFDVFGDALDESQIKKQLQSLESDYQVTLRRLWEVRDELSGREAAQQAEAAARAARLAQILQEQEALRVQTQLYDESIRQSEIIMEQAKEQEQAQRRIDTLVKQSIPDREKIKAIEEEIADLVSKGARITDDQRQQVLRKALEDSQKVAFKLGDTIAEDVTGELKAATLEARNLTDVFDNLLAKFGEAIANKLIFAPFENAASSYLSGLSFGGFRATGGGVSARKAYIVGENGPELFAPQSSGTIIPNDAMGSGGTTVVIHNYSDQKATVQKSNDPSGRELVQVFIGEVNKNIAQGGSVYQTMRNQLGVRRQPIGRT